MIDIVYYIWYILVIILALFATLGRFMSSKSISRLMLFFTFASVVFFSPYALAEEAEQPITVESIEDLNITINVENISNDNTDYYIIYDNDGSTEISNISSDGSNKIKTVIEDGNTIFVVSYNKNNNKIASSFPITVYTSTTHLDNYILRNDTYLKTLSLTKGEINLNGRKLFVHEDAIINSDFYVNSGDFIIGGNLIHSNGTLTIGGGTVDIKGDYKIINYKDGGVSSGKLKMTDSEDNLNVDGNFITDSVHPHTDILLDGVFRLKGDFSQINSSGRFLMSRHNFDTDENFKIVFCGDDTQTVYFYDPKRSQFSIWEVENTSEKPMKITHGFGIRTLKQDSVIPCDVEVWSHLYTDKVAPPIDLNGYTLRIQGNLINNRVNMRVSKGKLIVEGDYILQIVKKTGEYAGKLRWSYGTLRMLNDDDYVLVMGDFLQDSYYSHSNCMLAGTLEVKGDFRQITTNYRHDTHYNFDAKGTHRVILSGDGLQIVDFEDPETNQFNILEIPTDNKPGHIIMFTSEWRANEIIDNSTMTALLNWAE